MDTSDWPHKVLVGKGGCTGNWTRGCALFIVAVNLSTFCTSPKTLSEIKFRVVP